MERTMWFLVILLSLSYFFANVRSLAQAVEPAPEECTGKYATTTDEGGFFTVSTNVYDQCVQDNGRKGTKEQYWLRYECEYDEEEAPGTLVKYVYAANDMCVGNETDIVDIDPEDRAEVITDWCCEWVEDSEPSTSTSVEEEPEECTGKYATTTDEGAGGFFTVSTNVYEQCVQDTKEQYWMRYECEYDEEEAPGTLVKYVYAANDMCVGNETDIVDIDPEVITDWCCQWVPRIVFQPVLLPPPDEDSEPSTSTPTTPSPAEEDTSTTKSFVTTMPSTRNMANSIAAPIATQSTALASTPEDLDSDVDADEGVEDGNMSPDSIASQADNTGQSSAHQNHSHAIRAAALPGMPVHALSLLIVLVIFCAVVYSFATSKSIQPFVKVSVLFTILANATAIASIIAMSSIMITADQWDTATYETASMPYFAAVFGYIAGKMGLETFFILRAYNAFKRSAFAVSKRTVYVAFFCMLTIAVLWASSPLLVIFFPVSSKHMQKDYFYVILSVLDSLFVAGLLFIFISKLNGLVLGQQSACAAGLPSPSSGSQSVITTTTTQSTTPTSTAPGDSIDFEKEMHRTMVENVQKNLNVHQTELIFVMTRCIILNSIAFCTTILFGFLSFFYLRNAAPLYVVYSSWSLDMLINSVCLYLNLACSAGLYNRGCICCHQKCQRLMEHYAAQRIVRDQTTPKGETEQSKV